MIINNTCPIQEITFYRKDLRQDTEGVWFDIETKIICPPNLVDFLEKNPYHLGCHVLIHTTAIKYHV